MAVVAYIHPRPVCGQVCGSCSRYQLRGLAHRSGESIQEETELKIKDE